MAKKKSGNNITPFKTEFESILVCNDRHLSPFLEILIQEPENINNQNLGTLIGVFEVTDTSKDSSYIVNYLISVIKKEYFSKAKRTPTESLESALHKANLALSKLAEHGNIGWLGKLNVLLAVIERNNLHLSQAGTASALLLRSKTITDVSEGLAPTQAELHPLKTFVSVSSGKLELNDKLILTTDSIFDIFSLEEIKKSSLRFSGKKFVQFLKTALGSELEKSAVLVIELNQQETVSKIVPKKHSGEVNVFSNNAFQKKEAPKNTPNEVIQEIEKEIQYEKSGFVDEKTGHIYIKEAIDSSPEKTIPSDYTEEITSKFLSSFTNVFSKIINQLIKIAKKINLAAFFSSIGKLISQTKRFKPDYSRLASATREQTQQKTKLLFSLLKITWLKTLAVVRIIFSQKNKHTARLLCKNSYHGLLSLLRFILPSYQKIKHNLNKMSYQKKIYAGLIILFIVIAPILINKTQTNIRNKETAQLAITNKPEPLPLEQDKNVVRLENLETIYSTNTDPIKIVRLNEAAFAITDTEIINLAKNTSFSIPAEFKKPAQIVGMDDLNLIFLLNGSNQIISFSPISSEFKNNNLEVPANASISALGSYLTYIYLLDSNNNQIYRYPRAEGGFGEKTNWLKDDIDLTNVINMAMSENIFITDQIKITKLFRGQTQNFSFEQSTTPIEINALAIDEQNGNIFILDKQNDRIIQLDADGKIVTQYYNPEISSVTDIAISENQGQIYLSLGKEIKSISIK